MIRLFRKPARIWVRLGKATTVKFFKFPAKYQEHWKNTRFRFKRIGIWVRVGRYVYAVRWDR